MKASIIFGSKAPVLESTFQRSRFLIGLTAAKPESGLRAA
jgi:hypothetical protein